MAKTIKFIDDKEKSSRLSNIPNIELLLNGYRVDPRIYAEILALTKEYSKKIDRR